MATVSLRTWVHRSEVNSAFVVRYIDKAGSRRLRTFKTRALADDYRSKLEEGRSVLKQPDDAAPIMPAGTRFQDMVLEGENERHVPSIPAATALPNPSIGGQSDPLFGAKAIANFLGIRSTQAYHLMAAGILPSFKIGKTVCARKSSIEARIAALEEAGAVREGNING